MYLSVTYVTKGAILQIQLANAVGQPVKLDREWELPSRNWAAPNGDAVVQPGPEPSEGLAITDCLVMPNAVPSTVRVTLAASVDLKDGKGPQAMEAFSDVVFRSEAEVAGIVVGPRPGDPNALVTKVDPTA